MKLLRLTFRKGEHQSPLDGINLTFHSVNDLNKTTPICLAGVNGSGKSKLLELIANIFFYLDEFSKSIGEHRAIKTKLQFEIEYILEARNPRHVRVFQLDEQGYPTFQIIRNHKVFEIVNSKQIVDLLPRYIIGYSSGDNETLSRHFEEVYMSYSEDVTDLVKNPMERRVPNTRLVFLNYKVNSYVFISNSLFRSNKELTIISDKVKRLNALESFRITIQERPRYKGKLLNVRLTPELGMYTAALRKCATCSYYESETEKTILDFYINPQTKQLFKRYFKTAFNLYNSLYKLDLLNDILLRRDKRKLIKEKEYPNQKIDFPLLSSEEKAFNIDNVRVNLNGVTSDVDYYELSDGEHQLIHVFGSLLMIEEADTLFLLDEPETHFNPQWRAKFISILNDIKHTSFQDFFITTHSPFILGDCKQEHVLIFNQGKAHSPEVQTFGLSMDRLLKEAFGIIPPMSEKSLDEIRKLQKSSSIRAIETNIDGFGESIEKFYLFDRLAELKKAQSRKSRKK